VRVLLVEDEPRVAGFIAKGLREQTYAVDVARDGPEALYSAGVNDYDLVILDVMLPVKDGYAVCRELSRLTLRNCWRACARSRVERRRSGLK
jgi:DNA-binding response OmpR family regulator